MQRRLSILFRALPAAAFALGFATTANAQLTHLEALDINGANETPPNGSTATGRGDFTLNTASHVLTYNISFGGLSSMQTLAHLHKGAPGVMGPIVFTLPLGSPISGTFTTSAAQETDILASLHYVNIHTGNFGGGEIRGQVVPAPAIGTAMCFGDGTGAACPCANSGAAGHGCENSSSTGGAQLAASGHNSPDNVVLISTGEKPTSTTVFFTGNAVGGPFLYGDGLRCITGAGQKRLAVKSAAGGAVAFPEGAEPTITARSMTLGVPISPGDTRYYVALYRDPDAGFCTAATFNSSNVVQIVW